ncbi:allantoicase [Mycobacterium sp. MS1601]|uniref:allantoicase n=1 Tax=Mycobacterium sp. MS1601 TaxID=1936029 RepID=UPI0009793AF0|nr:allantoicase [Mycobacterium sp. MS1601]AQA05280.1 allantoicase [Mycobacterium sp. MS1601]
MIAASDESFGAKELLLSPGDPAFVPGTYDLRGEVVDGWETRRHAGAQGDWAVVRLGAPGRVVAVDVDTRFFTGNHPTGCRVLGAVLDQSADACSPEVAWIPLVGSTVLKPDSRNLLAVSDRRRITHVKLQLESDGGVARLRVYGEVIVDPADWDGVTVEMSGIENGGTVVWSSDTFYSDARSLIAADRPATMGDGWETRRRRDIGPDSHDAVIIALAAETDLCRIEIDTTWFVFNASRQVCVLGSCDVPADGSSWWTVSFDVLVLDRVALLPDMRRRFPVDVRGITALRIQAYPDGGIARVRALGRPSVAGLAAQKLRWAEGL